MCTSLHTSEALCKELWRLSVFRNVDIAPVGVLGVLLLGSFEGLLVLPVVLPGVSKRWLCFSVMSSHTLNGRKFDGNPCEIQRMARKTFSKSLAAQMTGAGQGAGSDRIGHTRAGTNVEGRVGSNNDNNQAEDDDESDDDNEDSDEERKEDEDDPKGANSRYLHFTKQPKQCIENFAM